MTRFAHWVCMTVFALPIALLMAVYVAEFGWAFTSSVAASAVAIATWVEIGRRLLRGEI